MKTLVRAGLAAVLAAATVLPSPAEASTGIQRTAFCSSGGLSGRLTLEYETSGGYHHPVGAYTASGPYIGDSGTLVLQIAYRQGATIHTIYTRSVPTSGSTSFAMSGLDVPVGSSGTASAKFDNGTASCTATVPIT
jgi:hypothetical protein